MSSQRISGYRSPRSSGNHYRKSSPVKQHSGGKRSVSPQKTEGKSLLKRTVAGAAVGAAIGVGIAAAPAGAIAGAAATFAAKFLVPNALGFLGGAVINAKIPAAISEDRKSYKAAKKTCACATIAAGLLFLTPALAFAGYTALKR